MAIVNKNVIIVVVTVVALLLDIVRCKSEYKEFLSLVNLIIKRCHTFDIFI